MGTSGSPPAARVRYGVDAACALLLFTATLVYLLLQPRHLMVGDESYFLYEAKRIRDGEVMYRDIFQFVTPLSSYGMAAVFWLFGTTITAARSAMAVVHAATVGALYATARRLQIRRGLAASAALAYLAICYPLYAYASWHWFATLGTALLLLSLAAGTRADRARAAALPGVLTGIVIGTQQQKGVVLAAGVVAIFVLDALIDYRYRPASSRPSLLRQMAWFAAGVALVVVPLLAVFAAIAGPEPVYAALVRFPLENYRGRIGCAWGAAPPMGGGDARHTFPLLLRYGPAALLLPALQWALMIARRSDRQRVRALTVLIVLSAFSAQSIRYYPDLIHIAFIAAAFWLCAAAGIEWIASALRPAALGRVAAALTAAIVSAALVVHLASYLRLMRSLLPIVHDTAFGRMDFSAEWEPLFIDAVRERLATADSQEIFAYGMAGPYLTTGGRNPTPYQFFEPTISPRSHTENTLAILEQRRVPYIVTTAIVMRRNNAITQFIKAEYDVVDLPSVDPVRNFSTFTLYGRKQRNAHAAAPAP